MLKKRLLTALVAGALMVGALFTLGPFGFGVLILALLAIGAWEWGGLLGVAPPARAAYTAAVVALLLLLLALWPQPALLPPVLTAAALFWCAALGWLGIAGTGRGRALAPAPLAAVGVAVLVPPWLALMALRETPYGPAYVLFLLALIWIADSGAYFAGRRFGRRKLAPRISPGKTWEGVAGALAATLAVALAGAYGGLLPDTPSGADFTLFFILLCLLTVVFSIVGDLFESLFKRQRGVKDSGALLPGHGGMLDRIDSLTAAAPLFAAGLLGYRALWPDG